jgi:hypothetical protein
MNALYFLAIILFFIPFVAAVFIIKNSKGSQLKNSIHGTIVNSAMDDEMTSNLEISTEATKSINHIAIDIEPMIDMINPSTGAVMIDSAVDSTGHTYGS